MKAHAFMNSLIFCLQLKAQLGAADRPAHPARRWRVVSIRVRLRGTIQLTNPFKICSVKETKHLHANKIRKQSVLCTVAYLKQKATTLSRTKTENPRCIICTLLSKTIDMNLN